MREKYNILPGDKIILQESKDGVLIKSLNRDHIKSFRGILAKPVNRLAEMRDWKKQEINLESKI